MSVFAIGDLHLSFGSNKPMDVFGESWENHTDRLREGFAGVSENDVVVLAGDSSWGMSMKEALPDFSFIASLPGKKLVLKGNHDYWWETASKTKRILSENGIEGIDIIHNNAFLHESTAICGTRGWFYEEDAEGSHGKKIYNRELGRLKTSLDAARALQASRIICFLHYPPICDGYECEEITEMLSEAGVDECCYGHLHGYGHVHGFNGVHEGVLYKLISADYLKFTPIAL